MSELIFLRNIDNMFERYYSNEKNVENQPLSEEEEKDFENNLEQKIKNITKNQYKKYIYIKEDILKISRMFDKDFYISRKIGENTSEPTKILKSEAENWDYLTFNNKYGKNIEKIKYFIPIYTMGKFQFGLD